VEPEAGAQATARPDEMQGQSGAGFDFACKQADWVFVAPMAGTAESYGELAKDAHARAAAHGRTVRVAASYLW
jgi:alkanesulfonate monooxygenase SsuD/methylene tetrahydromethanopterin reductase-like flavin-dependent oxidoreductase (luciferase family)